MCKFTKQQYEHALRRIEELIDVVPDCEPTSLKEAMELSIMSEIVMEYEDEHFPMKEDMEKFSPARTA